jgi:small nuclear ribonucleoprotein (snRNP)-like protein
MSQLPISRLTLYKQGFGYFERRGIVEGNLVTLVVPRDSINDVLKSLTVMIQGGGRVLGIDYETPEDKEKVLNELSVKLGIRSALVDVLCGLRGTKVTLNLENGEAVTGRLVGVETTLDPSSQPATVLIQSDDDVSQVQLFPVAHVVDFSLHDERAVKDIGFFLDVNRTEQTRITLTIWLSEGKHNLEIGCLAPGPTWRVSYRLVGIGQNQARLSGWGLFENSLDEDLNDVMLTLISGRPISFEYDLYESYIPARPQVSDDPTSLEAVSDNPLVIESLSAISHELRTPVTSIRGYAELLERSGALTKEQQDFVRAIRQSSGRMVELLNDLLDMARLREGQRGREEAGSTTAYTYRSGPLGDLKVSSAYFKPVVMGNAEPEFMTYPVEAPVSVRRGQSALVPIIDQVVEYEEICVYNGDKIPNHPLLVWRLKNTTGKALEQGPVTIVDEGRYLGEGLMRFTGVGDELQIPYALEFGVLVSETIEQGPQRLLDAKFDAKEQRAIVRRYEVTEYIYTLVSHVGREVQVLIERRDPNQGEYYEMPEPDLAASGHTRWPVLVPPNGQSAFTVRIRNMYERPENVNEWDIKFVQELRTAGLLADEVYADLKRLGVEKQQLIVASNRIKTSQAEYDEAVSRQEQLRKNLSILGDSEREMGIRNRVLDDLEASENRRRELEQRIADLNVQIEQHRRNQQELNDKIFGKSAGKGEGE